MQSAFRMASGKKKEGKETESLRLRLSESEESDTGGGEQTSKLVDVSSSDESDPGEGSSASSSAAGKSMKIGLPGIRTDSLLANRIS